MAEAARMVEAKGARLIDINMGCPAKKVVNGYLYTAAVPCDPDMAVPATEFGNVYYPRVPKDDPEYAAKIGAYLGAVLPTYGANFPDWWRNRLVPEMAGNLA